MKELTFDVPGISCQHCINAITKETQAVGVTDVQVDLTSKKVFITFDPTKVSEEAIKEAIVEEAGYEIAGRYEGRVTTSPTEGKRSLNMA
ncbi:MAG: heavy-metal-associated domain-containing protein [Chloroflexota bacterium]